MQDCKKDCGLDLQSQVEKWIASRNVIHFGTRIVDLECNPFKKEFADAWSKPVTSVLGEGTLVPLKGLVPTPLKSFLQPCAQ